MPIVALTWSDSSSGSSKQLSVAEIVGIVVGVLSFIVAAVGLYYTIQHFRKKKKNTGGLEDGGNGLALRHGHEPRAWEMMRGFQASGNGGEVQYKRTTVSIWKGTSTTEVFSYTEAGVAVGGVRASRALGGRVIEEEVD